MPTEIDFCISEPEEDLGYLLWQLTMQWQRQSNKILAELGFTQKQYVVMQAVAWLNRSQEQVTQKDIAKITHTDNVVVSKTLKELQKKDFISRQENPVDTRAKCVFLTEKGAEKLQHALNIKRQNNEAFIEKVADRDSFIKQLQAIVSN